MNYYTNKELIKNMKYTIELFITTVNGYETSVRYYLKGLGNAQSSLTSMTLVAEPDKEDGFIKLKLKAGTSVKPAIGSYTIFRKSSLDNFTSLDNLIEFSITGSSNDQKWNTYEWKDLTVEHGVQYQYILYKFSINQSSKTKVYGAATSPVQVLAIFDDLFLGDANRQLAVRFNPKVSSFKETLQETKVETIGSKYPFFFRNGHLRYKEIPISGLISYQVDNAELFISKSELGLNQNNIPTTNLVDYNIIAERKFREAVLEWLNNGQPKLFRSPTEGNCVIRLMNVSLSPNDTLGRMIYSFSATGYEIADKDYKTLYDLKVADCTVEGKKTRGYYL